MLSPRFRLEFPAACLTLAWAVIAFLDLPAAGGPPASGKGVQPRVDRYGDVLPPGAVARLGTIRFRQASWTSSVACSPDGKWLATADERVVRLWDAATGKDVREYRGPTDAVRSVAYSPDGKTIAAGAIDETVFVWDAATARELHRFKGQRVKLFSFERTIQVAFAPGGKALVSCGADETIRLWDLTTGKELRRFQGHEAHVWAVAFSADGRTLAAFATKAKRAAEANRPGEIRVWDVATGEPVAHWRLADDVAVVAFAPDLKTLVTSLRLGPGPFVLKLWDVATGKHLRSLPEDPAAVAFSADGKILVSVKGERFRRWDVATGKELATFANPHPRAFERFAFCPDGKTFVCWDGRNTVYFCDATTGKELRRFDGPDRGVQTVAFSPDGQFVASGGGSDVRLWEVTTQRQVRRFPGEPSNPVIGLSFYPDGKALFGSVFKGSVRRWDLDGGRELRHVLGEGVSWTTALTGDGKLLAARDPLTRRLTLWDTASWKPRHVWEPATNLGSTLAFSPGGTTLAGGGGKAISLWDVATGRQLPPVGPFPRWVTRVVFSPDGRLLAGVDWYDKIYLWETATGLLRTVLDTGGNVWSVVFSPDGRLLATTNSGVYRRTPQPGEGDGNADADKVCLLDVATGKVVHRFGSHRGPVGAVAFSPDGKLLASGSWDTTTLLWDVAAVRRRAEPLAGRPDARELDALWGDLAGADGAKAHRAVWVLAAAAERSLPFLKERLRPVPVPDPGRLARLLADLDSDRFPIRQKAGQGLESLRGAEERALRAALAAPRSVEFRRRVEQMLAKLEGPVHLPAVRREVRVVEVLEHAATAEARAFLAELGRGAPGARLTREALAALLRANRQPSASHPQPGKGNP